MKYTYQYNQTDYLSNVRVSFHADANQQPEMIQEDHYYPFGSRFGDGSQITAPGNEYLYTGKELQDELGLNWYDYGARMYDASLGRWNGVDALAEKYLTYSPYHYAGNNPIRNIDVDGNKFTDEAMVYVKKLIAEINKLQKENEKKIKVKETKLNGGVGKIKAKKLNKQIKRLEKANTDLEVARGETAILEASNQEYHVLDKGSVEVGKADEGGGKTTYNFSANANRVEIFVEDPEDIGNFAHELKHAYQFEVGRLDLTAKGGRLLHDKEDEYEGYARGALFGDVLYGRNNLPAHQEILGKGPNQVERGTTKAQMNAFYKSYKVANKVAYRLNKKTHFYDGTK